MAEPRGSTVDYEKLEESRPVEPRHSNKKGYEKRAFPRPNYYNSKGKNIVAKACIWMVDHQISISLTLLSALFLAHNLQPSLQNHTRKFFRISYYNESTGKFALGWDDIFFVYYWIIVFTGLRSFTMSYILAPLGESLGLKERRIRTRFAEQAWILIYPTLSFSTGMYIMYHSDYWLNMRALWRGYPNREMDGLSKWYYLVQFAFWLQQIVVVNIEERRKDHWQMFAHHLITCALIFGSYGYHFTKVGTLILCLMDSVDIFLALAKTLKYLKFGLVCDITFGVFMVTWFLARHVAYMWLVWSAWFHSPEEINFGCYHGGATNLTGPTPVPNDWKHVIEPFQDPVGTICFNRNVQYTFIGLLLALQGIMLIWFVMIIRVAYKVITGQGAGDVRSDDEGSDQEEEDIEIEVNGKRVTADSKQLLEQQVLSTDSSFKSNQQRNKAANTARSPTARSLRRKVDGHSSGVNLLAGSDRKDLLGRIGCDKGADL